MDTCKVYQSITVKFLPATNSSPARMRVRCALDSSRGRTIHYPANPGFDTTSPRACAIYAAEQLLININYGRQYPYEVIGVAADHNDDRIVIIE